jgi:D-sedoheptulose 7-phosphate isomerase
MDKETIVSDRIQKSILVKKRLKDEVKTIVAVADEIVRAFRRGNKVLLFGNGGSAADAQHIAAEFTGKYLRDRDPLPAIALTTNTSSLTAIANDYGYEHIFVRQLQAIVVEGDIVIGISTSGNSPNVLLAVEEAKRCGAITVVLTGQGGKLKGLADFALAVPSKETPLIQEAHIMIGHIICQLVEEEMFGKGKE